MFPDAKLKPLPAEESYALVGKEAQHFFSNKVYTPARRGDKFRELVQDTFENVRSTICVGWDAQNKPMHFLPMSTVLAGRRRQTCSAAGRKGRGALAETFCAGAPADDALLKLLGAQ